MKPIDLDTIKGPVYITPTSGVGLLVYHLLTERGTEVLGFCDNDARKYGKSYNGCPVLSRMETAAKNPDTCFIVVSAPYGEEIKDELITQGVSNIIMAEQFLTYENSLDSPSFYRIDEKQAAEIVAYPKRGAIRQFVLDDYPPDRVWTLGKKSLHTRLDHRFALDLCMDIIDYMANKVEDRYLRSIDISNAFTNDKIIDLIEMISAREYVVRPIIRILMTPKEPHKKQDLLKKLMGLNVTIYKFNSIDKEQRAPECSDGNIANGKRLNIRHIEWRSDEALFSPCEMGTNSIFIHIPKTAGTSLMKWLYAEKTRANHHHNRIISYKEENEQLFKEFFKFAIVRNPWDLAVSRYHFNKKNYNDIFNYSLLPDELQKRIQLACNEFKLLLLTFKEWMKFMEDNPLCLDLHQHRWICDDKDNILVDYIGRFENLEESFRYIASKIGADPDKPIPKFNETNRCRYQDYYDEETREIAHRVLKKDIEMFGYEFE